MGGPPLVKYATGEIVSAEDLGGAEMHARKSGVADQLAENELDAIRMARHWVASLVWQKRTSPPKHHFSLVDPPRYAIDDLLSIVPPNIKKPYDIRQVIARYRSTSYNLYFAHRITDGSRFLQFKPLYGANMSCGWGQIHGTIVSNPYSAIDRVYGWSVRK